MPILPFFAKPILLTGPVMLALSACAGSSDKYPSLAIRDVERAPEDAYRIDSGPPITVRTDPSGQILNRVAQLQSSLAGAHAEFMGRVPAARRSVAAARGTAIGSDSWASAQIALADLDSARSLAAVPLADLDAIYTQAAVDFVETARIAEVRNGAIALISEEDRILAALRATVRP